MEITAELIQKWLLRGGPADVVKRAPRILVPSWSRHFANDLMYAMRPPLDERLTITNFGMYIIKYEHGPELHFYDVNCLKAHVLGRIFDFIIMDEGERFPDPLGYLIFSSVRDGAIVISDLTV